ncbi:hypothetical protein CsSME_00028661 [Camellia sinensis var. sinensis]
MSFLLLLLNTGCNFARSVQFTQVPILCQREWIDATLRIFIAKKPWKTPFATMVDEDNESSSATVLDLTSFQLHDLDSVELPPSLTELDLTANRLSTLDLRIAHLSNLRKLSLRQNLLHSRHTHFSAYSLSRSRGHPSSSTSQHCRRLHRPPSQLQATPPKTQPSTCCSFDSRRRRGPSCHSPSVLLFSVTSSSSQTQTHRSSIPTDRSSLKSMELENAITDRRVLVLNLRSVVFHLRPRI